MAFPIDEQLPEIPCTFHQQIGRPEKKKNNIFKVLEKQTNRKTTMKPKVHI